MADKRKNKDTLGQHSLRVNDRYRMTRIEYREASWPHLMAATM